MAEPNFVNRTLWTGDNLHILRGLNSETFDLIYADPPFNSNRNYSAPIGSKAAGAAFKDTWTLSDLDVAWMGLIADEHPAIAYLLDAAGRTHGKGMQSYLTMMAVRLLEMRRVLKPTGSIYLHCDPFASHYLKTLMDSIFGPSQFRDDITWNRAAENLSRKKWRRATENLLYYTGGGGIGHGILNMRLSAVNKYLVTIGMKMPMENTPRPLAQITPTVPIWSMNFMAMSANGVIVERQ